MSEEYKAKFTRVGFIGRIIAYFRGERVVRYHSRAFVFSEEFVVSSKDSRLADCRAEVFANPPRKGSVNAQYRVSLDDDVSSVWPFCRD